MSSHQARVALPPELRRITGWLEENGFLVVILGMFTMRFVLVLQRDLLSDSWLALVSGRWIVQHGLPARDALTILAHGRRWVDQQWLAQVAIYGLWRLGGLKLALLVQALLSTLGVVGAALCARRLGATARSTAWVAIPAYVAYYPSAWSLRTQTFALPLFTATLWLVLSDARRPSRRVFIVLPLLALWANLHGSVVLGCAVVSLHGIVILVRQRGPSPRAMTLLLAPWACVFATPYALHLPGYYEKIAFGSNFSHVVSEWASTTLTATTAPAYLLVLGGVWLLGRSARSLPWIDQLVFVGGAVFAFGAIRNIVWFALIALVVLPQPLDRLLRPARVPRRLNRFLGLTVLVGLIASVVAVGTRPAGWFASGDPVAAAHAAADAAGPGGRVFASSDYADWLVWNDPQLAGRISFDTRLELLSRQQLLDLQLFESGLGNWRSFAQSYRVFVLGSSSEGALERALVRGLPARVTFSSPQVVVLRRLKPHGAS